MKYDRYLFHLMTLNIFYFVKFGILLWSWISNIKCRNADICFKMIYMLVDVMFIGKNYVHFYCHCSKYVHLFVCSHGTASFSRCY